jgi:phosphatidylglycerophosphatase GEP4
MIGDRYLTDVVYGNSNGLMTIRPAPLTLEGEPTTVRLVSAV